MARDVAGPLRGLKRLALLAKRSTEGRCPKGSRPSGDENNYRNDISSAYKSFRFSFQFHFSIMVTERTLFGIEKCKSCLSSGAGSTLLRLGRSILVSIQ